MKANCVRKRNRKIFISSHFFRFNFLLLTLFSNQTFFSNFFALNYYFYLSAKKSFFSTFFCSFFNFSLVMHDTFLNERLSCACLYCCSSRFCVKLYGPVRPSVCITSVKWKTRALRLRLLCSFYLCQVVKLLYLCLSDTSFQTKKAVSLHHGY
jgi:hypothetical protein